MSEYVIETKGLTKEYNGKRSVSDLNLHIKKGRIYGLLGRNGAGKTTTMKMILNLIDSSAGEVIVFGKSMKKYNKEILPRIGCLIESPGFYPNLTGTENLKIFAQLRGIPKRNAIKESLELVGLKYNDKKLFSQYSMGMKQRLAIALAVMHDPEILILDEPINGLDPIGIAEVRTFIRKLCTEKGKTILISSHILSEIELIADDIGIIDNGVLLEEESLEELKNMNKKYIKLVAHNDSKAVKVLEACFNIKNYSVEKNGTIKIYDLGIVIPELVRELVKEGIAVEEIRMKEDTLEDYFKRITGGAGIA
ncbi:ABC transporter ATP-binding protein [Peptoclostridium sp. AF21-18]|uniref:ABC transporter ATP-binding protein n=1 Tax=Peptoclostridium sp. AF21-18 TaxID=2292243 RepID=UPI000E4C630E|nr:ABC transporter ATP-binding protein [Peptoclostridium sp. AF21-18]RHQ97737.1 ABC transporter ATP-binding protein [Peptoclostridium sp. AF21-18]